MPLPSSLEAAVNTIEVLGRNTACTGGSEGDLLAFVDIGGTTCRELDILALPHHIDGTPQSDWTSGVEDLAYENTRLGFIKSGCEGETLVSPVIRARESTEVSLTRSNITFDAIEDTLVPSRSVNPECIGESIECTLRC